MLHLVMLEPLEERYTEQWNRWIPKALLDIGINHKLIYGEQLTSTIEVGDVLDVYGTNYYKFTQLQKIVSMIRNKEIIDGDELWFADLWFPGIESLFYIRSMTGIKLKISGVLHAGTWDKDDFTVRNGMRDWAKGFERTMLQGVDEVHLATQFHKDLITKYHGKEFEDKLLVTGLFFDAMDCISKVDNAPFKDKSLVVFPHRLTVEKRVEKFDKLAENPVLNGMVFVKTVEHTKGKAQYYKLLSRANYAVSFDGQETFGYSMLEALALGCIPLAYDGKSYKETMRGPARWKTEKELVALLQKDWDAGECLDYLDFRENKLIEYSPAEVAKRMFREYLI